MQSQSKRLQSCGHPCFLLPPLLTAAMKHCLSCFSVQDGGMLRTLSRVLDTTKLGLLSLSFFSSAGRQRQAGQGGGQRWLAWEQAQVQGSVAVALNACMQQPGCFLPLQVPQPPPPPTLPTCGALALGAVPHRHVLPGGRVLCNVALLGQRRAPAVSAALRRLLRRQRPHVVVPQRQVHIRGPARNHHARPLLAPAAGKGAHKQGTLGSRVGAGSQRCRLPACLLPSPGSRPTRCCPQLP